MAGQYVRSPPNVLSASVPHFSILAPDTSPDNAEPFNWEDIISTEAFGFNDHGVLAWHVGHDPDVIINASRAAWLLEFQYSPSDEFRICALINRSSASSGESFDTVSMWRLSRGNGTNPHFDQILSQDSVRSNSPDRGLPTMTRQVSLFHDYLSLYTIQQTLTDGSRRWIHVLYQPSENNEDCECIIWQGTQVSGADQSTWRPIDVSRASTQ